MSLIVQLGTTVVSKPGSNVTSASGSGGRNVSYRDSRVAAQSSPLGTITSNASNAGTMSGQHRTLVTAVGHSGTVRTVPAVNANVTAGAFKIHSQHHRVITSTQHAQVSVVQKSQSSATIQKPSPFMELQTRKVIVPATANSKLSSELMKEAPLEKLQQSPANEEKKQPPTQIPLMYQYVLQEHNYVALPPASPPLSPAHHHSAGPKVNGAPSSASPSSLNSEPNAQHHPLHHAQLTPHNQQNPGILASRQSVHTLHSPHGGPQTPHPTRPTNLNLDDGGSDISSDAGREIEPEGEETETAPEAEGEDDSVTRCICDFEHDDGYMICCDKCSVWQHVDCMGIDRMNIPDEYMCERCQPRRVDKMRARNIQCRKREEFFHNDTSSDSSTSSTDSEPLTIVAPGVVKKRGGPGQGSGPGPAGRRKNEPLRKQPVGNPGYRQRRDSGREMVPSLATPNQRRQPTPRKKSTENKRAPRRRKQSKCGDEDKSPETWEKSPPIQSLRQWIDNYEEAVTNHYSPELRARIQSIRVNGVHSELKVPSHLLSGSSGVAKCRLTMLPNGTKILVTTCPINANQPIIELRGKYMLSQQHRALSSRNTPLPGPFLFFHRLPLPALREATEVCVDCRTYGNDARFVRRSCKPNSEVRHCVEKGTLHLFLVTLCSLEKNAEITIRHQEGANLPCCCGNPKECSAQSQIAAQNSSNLPRKNGTQEDTTRRRRGRRRTVSSSFCRDLPSPTGRTPPSPVDALSPVTVPTPVVPAPIGSPPHSPVPEKKRRLSPPSSPVPIKVKEETKMKEEVKVEPSDDEVSSSEKDKPEKVESKPLKVEKVESSPSPPPTPPTTRNTMARRSSTVNKQQPEASPDSIPGSRRLKEKEKEKEREKERDRKDDEKPVRERRGKSESEPEPKNIAVKSEPVDKNKNRALTREERKMEAIMKAFERMEKLAQKKQEAQVRQQRQKSSDKNDDQDVPTAAQRKEIPSVDKTKRRKRKGRGRSASTQQKETPQASTRLQRRTRLLRGSGRDTEPDVDQEQDNDVDPDQDVEPDADDMSSDEETQSPRSIFQDVNNKTPPPNCDKDAGSCSSQGSTPPTPLSSACLLVAAAVGPLAPGFKFPKTKKGLLTSWFKTPDGASTPEPGKAALPYMKPLSPEGVNNNLVNSGSGSAGFAKKRWLRQAISEDHADSPNGRAGPGETIECVTPLKKRRLARESMSADSPANNDFESDQPTPDEDTLDGPTPVNETVDNEMSSPDEGSQSAEDIEIPPVNRPQATFEDVPMPPVCEPPVCVPPADDFMGGDSEVDESIRFPPEPPQHFSEPETVTTHILHVPPVPLLGASMQGPPTDPRSRPRENPLKPPLMPLARPVPPLSSMNSNPPNPAPVPIVAPPAARYVAPPAPVPQPPEPPAIKRKLSISEYRQRKQRTSTDTATPKVESSPTPEPTVTNNVKPVSRSRSSSTSSSSSLSSDDESSSAPIMNKIRQLDMRAAKVGAFATTGTPSTTGSAIPSIVGGSISGLGVDPSSLVKDGEGDDKKVGSSWSSAPTLVERQRENLTERLRREFGLFVNDEAEEAERVRKQALLGAVGATSEPTAPVLLAASGLGAAPAVAPAVAPVVAPAGVPVAAPAVVPTVAPAVVPAALPAVIPAAVPVAVPVAAPAPMASAAVVATPATPPVVPGPVKDIKDKDKEKDKDMMMANPIPSLGKKKGSLPPPPPPGLPPSSVPYTTPPGANPPPPAHLMPQPPPPGTGPGPIPLQLPARGQYARARPSSGFYYPPFSRP